MRKAVIVALLIPLLLGAKKFYDDDPLEKVPLPLHVEEVKTRKLNDVYDLFENTFGQPAEKHPNKKKSQPRKSIQSQGVNTLGEVADDPAWFINRIGSRPMSAKQMIRGPGNKRPPSTDGKWKIVGAKTSGVTPGFRIQDSTG